ncbi:uncharacterized protein LOC124718785 [Schistocerca piceifrons]|uniref:uncharacterized protein LOC124718785 n=1 Tax=Schistocerca piceifrons TaxID=274613 RepID=UPI001F5E3951|nr:uncharacterized protein LOC124718785 [Schistocerca piceifrons]
MLKCQLCVIFMKVWLLTPNSHSAWEVCNDCFGAFSVHCRSKYSYFSKQMELHGFHGLRSLRIIQWIFIQTFVAKRRVQEEQETRHQTDQRKMETTSQKLEAPAQWTRTAPARDGEHRHRQRQTGAARPHLLLPDLIDHPRRFCRRRRGQGAPPATPPRLTGIATPLQLKTGCSRAAVV